MKYDNTNVLTQDMIKKAIYKILSKDDFYNITKIVLFGSYSRNEAEVNSDIDLVVYDSPEFKGMKVYSFIGELKEELHKDIDLFVDRNIVKNSLFYKNILRDGVVVYG